MRKLLFIIPFCVSLALGQTYTSSYTGTKIDSTVQFRVLVQDTLTWLFTRTMISPYAPLTSVLKNADSTTLKNALLKNADSTKIRNYSNSLYLTPTTGAAQIHDSVDTRVSKSDAIGVGTLTADQDLFAVSADSIGSRYGMGWFNVKNYGTGNNSAAIQEAIDSANSRGSGTVYLPVGSYSITSTIRLTHDNVSLVGDRYGTRLVAVAGFADTVLAVYASYITVSDLYIEEATAVVRDWVGLALHSPTGAIDVLFNHFNRIFIHDANIGLDMSTASTGNVNSNTFSEIWLRQCRYALRTRESDSSTGLDANMFNMFQIQTSAADSMGIDSLTGYWNHFNGLFIWDAGGSYRNVITSGAAYTTITGGDLKWAGAGLVDNGVHTTILDPYYSSKMVALNLEDSLVIQSNKGNGTATVPSGFIGIKLKGGGTSQTANGAVLIQGANSGTDDYGSFLYLKTHPTTIGTTYTNAFILGPAGVWKQQMMLRAVAVGDSVFGTTFLRNTDTCLVMWNGTAWITMSDLSP